MFPAHSRVMLRNALFEKQQLFIVAPAASLDGSA